MGITSFIGGSDDEGRVGKFNRLVHDCETKREERELEATLLEPEKIKPYAGKRAAVVGPRDNAVFFFLPGPAALALVQKYFRVSTYVEKAVSDSSLLLLLLEKIESGELHYDQKNKELTIGAAGGSGRDCEGSAPVDTRKQGACNRSRRR
jgi:hypothetical protein